MFTPPPPSRTYKLTTLIFYDWKGSKTRLPTPVLDIKTNKDELCFFYILSIVFALRMMQQPNKTEEQIVISANKGNTENKQIFKVDSKQFLF